MLAASLSKCAHVKRTKMSYDSDKFIPPFILQKERETTMRLMLVFDARMASAKDWTGGTRAVRKRHETIIHHMEKLIGLSGPGPADDMIVD